MPVAPDPKTPKNVAAGPEPTDWQAVLGMYGMTPDMINQINELWKKTGGNAQVATPLILAYVRGTQWYQQQYPGIDRGIQSGLFNDERGYQQYKNALNQTYQQFYHRPVTAAEVGKAAAAGQDPRQIEQQFQSKALAGTITDPLKGLFTPTELKAFRDQAAGITTQLGLQVTAQANMASNVQSLYQQFYGRLPTRQEVNTLVRAGRTPEDIARSFATQENINAMNPAVSHLFTPSEIHQIALDQAGGVTKNGQELAAQAKLAADLNPVYHQYAGHGVARSNVLTAYRNGWSADYIAKRFAGMAYANANKGDIQQTMGSYGAGQLTPEQLRALGNEQAGIDTPLGQQLSLAYEKAQRRMQSVFRGTVARVNANLPASTTARRSPDVAA